MTLAPRPCRRLSPRRARRAAVLFLLLLPPGGLPAQERVSWTLVVDNDHFNFWQPEHRRPDVEYTQGLELSMSLPAANGETPLPLLWSRRAPCPTGSRCTRWHVGVRQEIYTPSLDDPPGLPGQRPYAGWLAVQVGVGRDVAAGSEQVRLVLGVTGEPSLAESAQRGVHALFGYGEPEGWEHQLPFEPGVTLEYRTTRRVFTLADARGTGVALRGTGAVRAGTAATGAAAGVELTAGLGAARPWSGVTYRLPGRGALYLIGAARLDAVLRSVVLQGPLFRGGAGVALRPLVPQTELGLALRYGRVALEWRAIHRGREYRTQPRPHTYSSIGVAVLP
jgi:hypothetical protein